MRKGLLPILLMLVPSIGLAQSATGPKQVSQISGTARFRSIDNKGPIRIADYKGKIVVLVLWASWCGPCRIAISGLKDIQKEFALRGVQVIALSQEETKEMERGTRRFLAKARIPFRVGRINSLLTRELAAPKNSIPQIFVIKDAVILKRLTGWNQEFTLPQLRTALEETIARNNDEPNIAATVNVGMTSRDYTDEKRKNWQGTGARPLRTTIWYPAAPATGKSETIFGGPPDREVFSPVTVAGDAEISISSLRYPLVLLSHGTGGSAIQMMWLGHYLASRGYIVAAVNHHGNTSAETERAAQGFLLYWERARDISVVLDRLLADPVFGSRIDQNRIGAAGFSLGGYSVITIAGGVFSPQEFKRFCESSRSDFTCQAQPEFPDAPKLFEQLEKTDPVVQESLRHARDSYRDKRIKRVFAIAPALGGGFTKWGLRRIRVPVSIVVGESDEVAPSDTNARRYANLIKGSRLTVIPGKVGHLVFLAECSPHGRATIPICRDAEGVDRTAVHLKVSQMAFEFFEK